MKTFTKIVALHVGAGAALTTSIILTAKRRNGDALIAALAARALMLKASWVRDEDTIARVSAGAESVANMDIEKIIANAVAASRTV